MLVNLKDTAPKFELIPVFALALESLLLAPEDQDLFSMLQKSSSLILGIQSVNIEDLFIKTLDRLEELDEIGEFYQLQVLLAMKSPTIENWSLIFPFLSKSRSAPLTSLMKIETDRAGMILQHREKYLVCLLRYLMKNSTPDNNFVELLAKTWQKILQHYHDDILNLEKLRKALRFLLEAVVHHRLIVFIIFLLGTCKFGSST